MTEYEKEITLIEKTGIKTSPQRLEYEKKVRELRSMPEKLKAEGYTENQIARAMHEKRRELGRQYKEAAPPLFREYLRGYSRKIRRSTGPNLRNAEREEDL